MSALIPQSQVQNDIGNNPVILAIKKALDDLDQIKEAKSKVFEEAV